MPTDLETHYLALCTALAKGRVVPFLGAGASVYGRPADAQWRPGQSAYLPTGAELAGFLARFFAYPGAEATDLARIAQYATLTQGDGPLYEELRAIFNADYDITPLHRLLAGLPAMLRAKGYTACCQLILTTNYDDLLERAFRDAGEPFDLVTYDAEDSGRFIHHAPDAEPQVIRRANEYAGIPLDEVDRSLKRSLILKLHGAVDRASGMRDSFVITEDHYIDYLARRDISDLLPQALHEKLKRSNFLFLGYGLRDWNLRVILHRIWGEQRLRYNSWAVQRDPDLLDQKFWSRRNVEILNVEMERWMEGIAAQLRALEPNPAAG